MVDLEKVAHFAESHLKYNDRPDYPFRSRYTHTLRVVNWAKRLQKELGGDIDVLLVAAYLHDIGWSEEKNHAIVSREIAENFVKTLGLTSLQQEKILEAIEHHNQNDVRGLHHESYVIMDADELDEVGALTIGWDSMSTAIKENPSFEKTYQRIKMFFTKLEQKQNKCYFDVTKKIYQNRLQVIRQFIADLEYELGYIEKSAV